MKTFNKQLQISVYGVGSSQDLVLFQSLKMAVEELMIPVNIKEIRDIDLFVEKGISAIPALAINDEVIVYGRVPSVTEIKALLKARTILGVPGC